MKRRFIAVILGLLLGAGAVGQEQHNYLAVNGQAQAAAVGPYYFISQGNSSDAFVKADLFAQALGVAVKFDAGTKQLVFSRGGASVTLKATGNILQGLQARAGTLQVDGEVRNSPMGIIVAGSSYVPVSPIVEALGGSSDYDPESQVLFVDTAPVADTPAAEVPLAEVPGQAAAGALGPPRYGFQETSSRVALNLPAGTSYRLLVAAERLAVQLDGVSADAFRQAVDDPFLKAFYFADLGGNLALVVDTHYPLAAGRGYRVGLLPVSAERPDTEVLYIDFAPELQSEAAAPLPEAFRAELPIPATAQAASVATTRAPAAAKKTVVIDPGHGGKFAGAQGYVAEEDVVLQVALKLKALLERQGVTVLLTREDDRELDPNYRADLRARGVLASPETNLFISIHANAASSGANGIETWVFGAPIDDSLIALAIEENGGGDVGEAITQEALAGARSVMSDIIRQGQLSYSETLAEMVQAGMIETTGAKDRGVRQNAYQVLWQARTPAVLVEIGFVTNPDEGPKLGSDGYQSSLAQGLADGILAFLNQGVPVASR